MEYGSLVNSGVIGPLIVQSSLFNQIGTVVSVPITISEPTIDLNHCSNKTHLLFKNSVAINGSYKFTFLEPYSMFEPQIEEIRLVLTFIKF